MKHAAEATPNHSLRKERELRGWSQGYVAEQIQAPTRFYVSRWERGAASPSPYYREKLCRLFGKNAQELGLLRVQREITVQQTPAINIVDEQTSADNRLYPQYQWLAQAEYRDSKAPLNGEGAKIFSRASAQAKPWRKRSALIVICLVALSSIVLASTFLFADLIRLSTSKSASPSSLYTWPAIAYDVRTERESVKTIQYMLMAHGYDVGKAGADGFFGPRTQQAVLKFQQLHKLPANGIVNSQVWEKLIIPSGPGNHGSYVNALQRQLNAYNPKSALKVDGIFNSETEKAVRQFQQMKNLPATGRAELDTWCLLVGGHL